MNLKAQLLQFGQRAREAARILATLSSTRRNDALKALAAQLEIQAGAILEANEKDLAQARAHALSSAMIDRLALSPEKIKGMAGAIEQAAALPDPVGEVIREWTRPNGIRISKVRVPIGVVAMIYESRPNVTSDAAALCLKTGNAVILRGGSEAIHSNSAIALALQTGCAEAGLPGDSIALVPGTDREAVRHLAEMDSYIDVIIPRGGQNLIEAVVRHARMPVIKHAQGVCAIYVDKEADLGMAEEILVNAKMQRPGVCNAAETLLVHEDVAQSFLERLARRCPEVELRADAAAFAHLTQAGHPHLRHATEADWKTEYLDLILAVRVVKNSDEAIDHIGRHGSHHSDCIVTNNTARAERFLNVVDSATVYWNASTRFTDGSQFGFGAEIGISTEKIGARGPMGLEELTSYKYIIRGTGQVRE